MLTKYSEFDVVAPGGTTAPVMATSRFRGARAQEIGRYVTLRATPNAELADRTMRAGDLCRTVRDLAAHTLSRPGNVTWPPEIGQIVDSHPHAYVTFKGDLDGETAEIIIVRDRHSPSLTASVRDPETRLRNKVEVSVVTFGEPTLTYDAFLQGMDDVDDSMSRYELINLHAAVLLASDRRLVYVTELDCINCEQALRLVHAVVAFLAQNGMISGASLVAINTRGYRFGPRRLDPAGLIQCALNSPI